MTFLASGFEELLRKEFLSGDEDVAKKEMYSSSSISKTPFNMPLARRFTISVTFLNVRVEGRSGVPVRIGSAVFLSTHIHEVFWRENVCEGRT